MDQRAHGTGAEQDGLAVQPAKCPLPKWGRRLGAAAFLFFLIKGLMWLIVPAVLAWWAVK